MGFEENSNDNLSVNLPAVFEAFHLFLQNLFRRFRLKVVQTKFKLDFKETVTGSSIAIDTQICL